MPTTITAIGGSKPVKAPKVAIEGFGSTTMVVTFDDNGVITEITFTGRIGLKESDRKNLNNKKTDPAQELCHKTGIDQIKKNIVKKYVGQSTFSRTNHYDDELNPGDMSECLNTTKIIAAEYLKLSRNPANIFAGDKVTNRTAGKLIYLLKPYIDDEDTFKENDTRIISIPRNKTVRGEPDFYEALLVKYPDGVITLSGKNKSERWAFLNEIYNDANNDNPSKHPNKQAVGGMYKFLESPSNKAAASSDDDFSISVEDEDDDLFDFTQISNQSSIELSSTTSSSSAAPTAVQLKLSNHRNTFNNEAARLVGKGANSLQNNSNKRDDDVKSNQRRERLRKR